MSRHDDPVEVRRGRVGGDEQDTAPEQFLWRGRLWKVRLVLASWTETGTRQAPRDIGPEPEAAGGHTAVEGRGAGGLLGDRELWRVEAGRGGGGVGVFELSFDHDDGGRWALVSCTD